MSELFLSMKQNLSEWINIPKMGVLDILEIIIIAILIYYAIKWIKNTRAWVIVKGLLILVFFWLIADILRFDVILWLFTNTIGVGITALIILFQPELRRVLENLGQRKILNLGLISDSKKSQAEGFNEKTVDELVRACQVMGKAKTGALIVIEQNESLKEYEETGIEVDGKLTAALLINIFEKNTPLHDGAVIVRGDRVSYATCYLPLSNNMSLSKDLGTRHRAAVGIAEASDAVTIIVSEETGKISITRRAKLEYNVDLDRLKLKLLQLIPEHDNDKKGFAKLFRYEKNNKSEKVKVSAVREEVEDDE